MPSKYSALPGFWGFPGSLHLLVLCHVCLCLNTCGVTVPRPRTVRACSVGCPSGTFESSPCTNFRDRVCQECTKCRGSTYEVKSCTGSSDRQCIHVAHPLLITGDVTTNKFLDELYHKKHEMKKRKKMKVEASSNVFLEDLHSTRNLETTYYVTDMTQAYDFLWDRESGLRVNIGILNIHLLPEYTDVDHESDNKYVLSNPDGSEDKTKFRSIIREYCRHPIPDYYSVTMEISRDRTTAAQTIVCDSGDTSKPRCPVGLKDGDRHLHRTPNDACHKMGTFPEPLQPAANSIVCTDHSALMRDVFNQTYSPERPIRFPPKKCRTARSRCDQCIEQVRCQTLELFEKKCCQVDCYTLLDCKVAHSEECTASPVECVMGDAYRYTIQPVFGNIKTGHQCHIRRRHSDVLYELFYFVQVPGTQFQTAKVHRTIYASDLSDYGGRGANTADFLTIEHRIGLDLEDEFLLHGQQVDTDQINYTVHSMKVLDELRSNRLTIHEISPRIFVASTQFERPFDYSTSTWTKQNDCNKNISKFQTVVSYDETSPQEAQGVKVIIENSAEPYHYFLKSTDNPPYIRFNVPDNMPILPYYFRNGGPSLYTNNSLSATLELTSARKVWDIHLSGKLSGCPGYVGVVISNREDHEELFRYDLLVLCPPDFNVTFKVPNWGQQHDKTFDLHLEDARHSYDIYLTQLTFEQERLELEPEAIQMPQPQRISSVVFIAVVASLFLSFLTFIAVYIYTEAAREKLLLTATAPASSAASYASASARDAVKSSYSDVVTASRGAPNSALNQQVLSAPAKGNVFGGSSTCLCRLYVIFRILYSVLFSFSVFYILMAVIISDDVDRLSQIEELQLEKRNASAALSRSIERHGSEEMRRQRELASSMQAACSHYVGELFDSLVIQMDKVLTGQGQGKGQDSFYRPNASVSSAIEDRIRTRLGEFSAAIGAFRNEYRVRVTTEVVPSLAKYRKYLEGIFRNNWLNFPQRLFNESSYPAREVLPAAVRTSCNLTGVEVDFGNFMEIQEVEEIQLWAAQLWQRFAERFPGLPAVPALSSALQCSLDKDDSVPNLTRRTPLYQLHSSHFFSSPFPEDLSVFDVGSAVEDAKFAVSSSGKRGKTPKPEAPGQIVFSTNLFLDGLDTDLLRIAFVILDLLVLAYRCTLTYVTVRALRRRFSHHPSRMREPEFGRWPPSGDANTNATEIHESMLGLEPSPVDHHEHNISNQHNIYTDPQTLVAQTTQRTPIPFYPQHPDGASKSPSRTVNSPMSSSETQYASMRVVFGRLLENDAFPKAIVVAIFVLLVYAFLRIVNVFLDVRFLVGVRAFGVFVNVLSVHVNQTNIYILDQAKFLNDVAMKTFEAQMDSELANLQAMVDFFNAEQRRMVNNYVAEFCSVADLGRNGARSRWGCEAAAIGAISPQLLTIPLIPCNFVPIQPHLFSGFSVRDYETQLEASFQQPVDAARNIILKSLYAALIVLTAMAVIHIFSWIVGRCLRLRRRPSAGAGPPRRHNVAASFSADAGSGTGLPADSSVQTFVHRHEGGPGSSDYESEDNDGVEFTRHTTVTNITMYRARTGVTEFKYSETNV